MTTKGMAWVGAMFLLALAMGMERFAQAATGGALPERDVLVLNSSGNLRVSMDGKKFKAARRGESYKEGAIFRASGGPADLFFRRIGTMVRLMPGAELEVEKLVWHRNAEGRIVKETVLDLRHGRVLTFVRVLFPESKFQVRTEAGLATVAGAGTGRYDIGANGRFVAAKSSSSALKVVVEGEERMVAPGEAYATKHKKLQPIRPSEREMMLIEADELEALAQQLTAPPSEDELPVRR